MISPVEEMVLINEALRHDRREPSSGFYNVVSGMRR